MRLDAIMTDEDRQIWRDLLRTNYYGLCRDEYGEAAFQSQFYDNRYSRDLLIKPGYINWGHKRVVDAVKARIDFWSGDPEAAY